VTLLHLLLHSSWLLLLYFFKRLQGKLGVAYRIQASLEALNPVIRRSDQLLQTLSRLNFLQAPLEMCFLSLNNIILIGISRSSFSFAFCIFEQGSCFGMIGQPLC
jgi:hypothetical protein